MYSHHNFTLVRCISKDETFPDEIQKGQLYWLDNTTRQIESDGVEYANISRGFSMIRSTVGHLPTKHFQSMTGAEFIIPTEGYVYKGELNTKIHCKVECEGVRISTNHNETVAMDVKNAIEILMIIQDLISGEYAE